MEYSPNELNSSGELVRKRVAKFMRQRSKSNRKLCLDVIKKTDKSWRKTVKRFAKVELRIEAKSTIAAIFNYMPNELEHFANIQDKHIEQYMIPAVGDAEAERNSSTVIDYLMNDLGFEKKKSAFSGRKLTIKNNLIIDNIKIAEGF